MIFLRISCISTNSRICSSIPAMMMKPNKYEICKTDIKNVIFELEKADAVYSTIKTLSASNRRYAINKLLTKLKTKLK